MAKSRERREYRVADASRRLAEHTTGSAALKVPEDLKYFQPKKGVAYEIDIVPYTLGDRSVAYKKNYAKPGELYFERTYFAHYAVGPDKDTVVCLARTFGKPCAICEYRNELALDPKSDKNVIKSLYAKERQLFLIFDHDQKEQGLLLWEVAFFNFGKQLDAKINNAAPKKKPLYLMHYHPENGYTLRVTNTEESMGDGGKGYLKFTVDEFEEREEWATTKVKELVEEAPCLDDIPVVMSHKEMFKLFHQIDEDDVDKTETDEEEETPIRNSRTKAKADDEEEETEEEEVEESAFQKGDLVEFEYRGDDMVGKVVKVDEDADLVHIQVEDREKPVVMDFDEVKKSNVARRGKIKEETEEEETEDEEVEEDDDPPPKARAGKGAKSSRK